MKWEVEHSAEFENWWSTLDEGRQDAVDRIVRILEELGPRVPFPYSSGIEGSRYKHLRELRIQHLGRPIRVLYAFDPRRVAMLLIGGDKAADKRWYANFVRQADRIYTAHLNARCGGLL